MSIITLTTDLGLKDHYVASLKGAIYTQSPNAVIVDISHEVRPFDINEAAYYIRSVYKDFPEGTIHIIGVKNEPTVLQDGDVKDVPCVLKYDNHYFIAANNGIFGLLLKGIQPQGFWQINDFLSERFFMKDITKFVFVPTACKLLNNVPIDEFATPTNRIVDAIAPLAVLREDMIVGKTIHIDNYGNIITNITKEEFDSYNQNVLSFSVKFATLNRQSFNIDKISESYGDVPSGNIVAFFNLNGFLEIGINQGAERSGGGASKLLGIYLDKEVIIEFTSRGSKSTLTEMF